MVDGLALYMSKYEEEFEPFLNGLMNEVWQVLMATSLAPHEDLLVTTAVKFLTTVGTSVHHALFAQPGILQNVCEKIISPNIQLIQADEDLFDPAVERGFTEWLIAVPPPAPPRPRRNLPNLIERDGFA